MALCASSQRSDAFLGFDWHSSGVTTTSTGALKEGIRGIEHDLGVYALGGKEATSRKTPTEILDRERLAVDPRPLLYASRLAAKVDSAALQDRYQLYRHSFFFSDRANGASFSRGQPPRCRSRRAPHPADAARPGGRGRATYDRTIDTLHRAMAHAKVDRSDKVDALKRLGRFAKSTEPSANDVH